MEEKVWPKGLSLYTFVQIFKAQFKHHNCLYKHNISELHDWKVMEAGNFLLLPMLGSVDGTACTPRTRMEGLDNLALSRGSRDHYHLVPLPSSRISTAANPLSSIGTIQD